MSTDYVLEVTTKLEKEGKHIRIGDAEYLLAKRDSEFKVELSNKSNIRCDVELYIGGQYINTWRINPRKKITLDKTHRTKRPFVFSSSFCHISDGIPDNYAEVCVKSSVMAKFIPAKMEYIEVSDSESMSEGEVYLIPDHMVHHHKIVTLTAPVMICDHHLE